MHAATRLRHRVWQGLVLSVAALVLSSCGWRGISNVPIPGGPGNESGSYTVYVQMPDTLAINGNSRVQVADVFVGSIREIKLKNWIATLTLGLDKSVKLPKNATAKIGQTSLLGSQHIELAAPANPSRELLKNGDTIPLKN
ncbi:MAG TPA: MlaD family protein, partial [Mycobacterium sp.]|nr:MlaD family protein [Mycobacterium sp.]